MRERPDEDDADALRICWRFERAVAKAKWPRPLAMLLGFLNEQPEGEADLTVVVKELGLNYKSASRISIDAEERGYVVRSRSATGKVRLTAAGRSAIGKHIHAARSGKW